MLAKGKVESALWIILVEFGVLKFTLEFLNYTYLLFRVLFFILEKNDTESFGFANIFNNLWNCEMILSHLLMLLYPFSHD